MNDLETPAFALNPRMEELKEQLLSCGFDQVLLSGSGSSFFCLGKGELPEFDGFKMIHTEPINRPKQGWYE